MVLEYLVWYLSRRHSDLKSNVCRLSLYQELSPAASRAVSDAYGRFFHQFAWDWFMTGTFSNQCSALTTRAAFQKYAEALEHAAGTTIFWVCIVETGVFGRFHQHVLIGNVQHLSRATWERRWRHGHARILRYDPGRGAAHYVTKHIVHPSCEFIISDHIEAFRRTVSPEQGGDSLSASAHQQRLLRLLLRAAFRHHRIDSAELR
jgi:hypothetical protein